MTVFSIPTRSEQKMLSKMDRLSKACHNFVFHQHQKGFLALLIFILITGYLSGVQLLSTKPLPAFVPLPAYYFHHRPAVSRIHETKTKSSLLSVASTLESPLPLNGKLPVLPKVPSDSKKAGSGTVKEKDRKLLCRTFSGRLGNHLSHYACVLGLAKTMNRQPVFQGSSQLDTILKTFPRFPPGNRPEYIARCKAAHFVTYFRSGTFHEEFQRLDPAYDFSIGGVLSYRYFDKYDQYIRQALTFSDEIQQKSNLTIKKLRQQYNATTFVGVHVRRGDKVSNKSLHLGYPISTSSYLNKSMNFMRALYPDCVFVIGSDSMSWCRQHVPRQFPVHFLHPQSPGQDMLVLSSLDHVIITHGTFSWWVGYFNRGGTVVYMKDFVRKGSYIAGLFNLRGEDFFYPEWIPL